MGVGGWERGEGNRDEKGVERGGQEGVGGQGCIYGGSCPAPSKFSKYKIMFLPRHPLENKFAPTPLENFCIQPWRGLEEKGKANIMCFF